MPIFVFGFEPAPKKKSAYGSSIREKFIEDFLKAEWVDELFVFISGYAIEVFAVSEQRERVVSIFFDEVKNKLGIPEETFKKIFFQKGGAEAVAHFYQRSMGLEPAGGNRSLKGFRDSFNRARDLNLTGPYLNKLYQRGLWLSEKVRVESFSHENGTNTESVITELAQKIFGQLPDRSALIATSSTVGETYIEKLKKANIGQLYFLDVGTNGIQKICERFHGNKVSPEQLDQVLGSIDIILVFDSELAEFFQAGRVSQIMNQRNNAPLLLATPFISAEMQSSFSKHYNIYYYDHADLTSIVSTNIKEQQKTVRLVEKLLDTEVDAFIKWAQEEELFRFGDIIGRSRSIQKILDMVAQIAQTDISVLIDGESGTGKELVAKAIHEHSQRRNNPFIVVNCGAIPENLLESELFGHVRGAFTGAISNKKGLFEVADRGTIFLDEIGETSQAMQVKLLRFLQEGEVKPVGGNTTLKVDVRLIAATNNNLQEMVLHGNFRQDLYYRLNVIQITVPPLRDRKEDILPLIVFFTQKYGRKMHKSFGEIRADAKERLLEYHWPGNVRELENAIERAVALSTGSELSIADLPPGLADRSPSNNGHPDKGTPSLQELEMNHIAKTLKQHDWDYERVTKILGIGRTTLWRKMKAYNISNSPTQNSSNKNIASD